MPDIHHQFEVAAELKNVFEAFTSAQGLNAWWTLEAKGEPVMGSLYRLYFGPDYDWRAKVMETQSNFALTWKPVQAMEDWLPTQFGFRLAESQTGTTVRFFHTGWESHSDHFAVTSFCWGQLLNGLKRYCESGHVVPFELRS